MNIQPFIGSGQPFMDSDNVTSISRTKHWFPLPNPCVPNNKVGTLAHDRCQVGCYIWYSQEVLSALVCHMYQVSDIPPDTSPLGHFPPNLNYKLTLTLTLTLTLLSLPY